MKIKVNGVEIVWNQETISYEQVCSLTEMNEDRNPSITYEAKNNEGFLRKKSFISVTEGTRIYCHVTGDA